MTPATSAYLHLPKRNANVLPSTREADGGDVQTLTDRTPRRASAADDRITSFDDAKIAALSFESGEPRVVIEGGTYVRYVPSGTFSNARGNGGYVHAIHGAD